MSKTLTRIDLVRTKIVANSIREIAADLRLIDVSDLIAFIHGEKFANIEDLVSSSTELFFKEGTMNFAWAAALDVSWDEPPTILIDMEFHHMSVSAFFTLALKNTHGCIDVKHIWFAVPSFDDEYDTARLADAIADARLVPVKPFQREKSFQSIGNATGKGS
ncbi:MAG: hypothetical protein ABSA13_02395 [Beijerinckiaceae bacterium]|jgi:hypothetical protein